jgi:hypothetical protein
MSYQIIILLLPGKSKCFYGSLGIAVVTSRILGGKRAQALLPPKISEPTPSNPEEPLLLTSGVIRI